MNQWTLHHGDCLPYLRTLPDNSIDLVLTDPPYCSGGAKAGARSGDPRRKYFKDPPPELETFEGDGLDQRAFCLWAGLWLAELRRVLRPGCALVTWIDWRQYPTLSDALQLSGLTWRGAGAWDKTESKARPAPVRQQVEFFLWATKGAKGERLKTVCSPGGWRGRLPTEERFHLTPKPIDLLRQLVRLAPPGGVVLDPFAGAGSTGIAALREGRRFIGAELSPYYAKVARERLAAESPSGEALGGEEEARAGGEEAVSA